MEFNGMINRFLKRDVESNKRRICAFPWLMYSSTREQLLLTMRLLDIKTYAVTPLNEECGLIEWVDNLRTLRELVIKLLRERGIVPNVCPLTLFPPFCLHPSISPSHSLGNRKLIFVISTTKSGTI